MSTTLRKVNGDIYINPSTGKPEIISGPEKAAQDIADVLLTPLIPEKTNRSFLEIPRDFGSELAFIRIPPQYTGVFGTPLISIKIKESIQRLQNLQRINPNTTSNERISKISSLNVNQVAVTDFVFLLNIELESGSRLEMQKLRPVEVDQQVSITSVVDDRTRYNIKRR